MDILFEIWHLKNKTENNPEQQIIHRKANRGLPPQFFPSMTPPLLILADDAARSVHSSLSQHESGLIRGYVCYLCPSS